MPKDTKTRYQGIYARHRLDCATEHDRTCNCSPSYWGQVWDRAARKPRKTKTLHSIAEARNARADLEATLRAGMLPASSTMRVAAAIEAYLRAIEAGTALNKHGRPYKPSAVRDLQGALESYVQPAFGGHRLADVRRGDVQRLVDSMTPEKSGSRVRTVVNSVRSLYAWAQDRELVDHDPASRVRLPAMNATPRDRVATVAEMQTLLDALDPADALPYALAVYATARRAEIRHVCVSDADLDLGVIYLGADDRGRKSRAAQRAVPIVKPLAVRLRRELLRRGRPDPTALLCPGRKPGGRNSGMLSFEGLQKRVDDTWEPKGKDGKPDGAQIGERITAHECRHTCASWLDAAGIRPVLVSQLMGHAAPARQIGAAQITQERYTHALPGELEQAREQFERFLAEPRVVTQSRRLP
ncbi:MAG TPA: site-specific integrase [Solirubrobacteraceae bacterium]|jgi:integrase|nr:site-specific integrase [Solirubrobacteraceae bacterium]